MEFPESSFIGRLKAGNEDVSLFRVQSSDYEHILELSLDENESTEEILRLAQLNITRPRWWTWDNWAKKSLPREQYELSDGKNHLTLYNYYQSLKPQHLDQILRVLGIYSGIRNGIIFDKVKYLLINDEQPINDKNSELLNGYGPTESGAVTLYPAAFRPIPSRVTNRVYHFEGTLTHEFAHGFSEMYIDSSDIITNEWRLVSGWFIGDTPRILPGGFKTPWYTDRPKACITDYARTEKDEDFCESMVAALYDPENLDTQKLAFIREKFLKDKNDVVPNWKVLKVPTHKIKLPETPKKFGIRLTGQKAFIITVYTS